MMITRDMAFQDKEMMMRFLFPVVAIAFVVGCNQGAQPQLRPDDSKAFEKQRARATVLKGACIKVESVRPNAFDGRPEYIAVWFLKEDGGLAVLTCAPSSPNWEMMNKLVAYRRYEIKSQLAETGERSKIISIEDGGEWVVK